MRRRRADASSGKRSSVIDDAGRAVVISRVLALAAGRPRLVARGPCRRGAATRPRPRPSRSSSTRGSSATRSGTRFIADLYRTLSMSASSRSPIPTGSSSTCPKCGSGCAETPARQGRGLLTAFRYGQISPGKSRIVLDLAGAGEGRQVLRRRRRPRPSRRGWSSMWSPTSREPPSSRSSQAYRDALRVEEAAKRDRAIVARRSAEVGQVHHRPRSGAWRHRHGRQGAAGAVEKDVTLAFAKMLGAKLEADRAL